MTNDPYATLGLTKTATDAEIKTAYRKLVRKHHPDLHPDDTAAEAKFKAVSSAYDLLKDPQTRARFDAGEIDASGAEKPQRSYYRDYAEAPQQRYRQSGGFQGFGSGGGGDPADIFAEILRQRARGGGAEDFSGANFSARGGDLRYTLEVPFLDAVRGAKTRIMLPGEGGLEVQIPRGTADGQTLRLRGKGAPGMGGGPAGDALVTIALRPHPVFRREGDDIVITLPITIDEAVLGGKITAPTIDGPVSLTVPKGASSGQVLRLRGRGVAHGTATGDQRVELRIVAPAKPDAALVEFLEGWRKTQTDDPRKAMFEGVQT